MCVTDAATDIFHTLPASVPTIPQNFLQPFIKFLTCCNTFYKAVRKCTVTQLRHADSTAEETVGSNVQQSSLQTASSNEQ